MLNAKVIFVLLLCTLLLIPISVSAQEGNQPTLSKSLKQRQAIAESDVSLSQISEQQISATGSALAEAIDIAPSILADASASGPSGASAVFEELGVIRPKQGSTFALLIPIPSDGVICETGRPKLVEGRWHIRHGRSELVLVQEMQGFLNLNLALTSHQWGLSETRRR
jgi:hypothetical protein